MSTEPMTPKPSRTPWIIAGVLGCLVVCLLFAVVAGGAFFLLNPQPIVRNVTVIVPTPMIVQVTSVPVPTLPSVPQPTLAQPTQPLAQPTQPLAQPTAAQLLAQLTPTPAPTLSTAVVVAPQPTTKPAAAPSGKIAFSVERGERPEDKTVWIMNADGSGVKKILDKASSPAFSPDGTKIAYFSWIDGIFVANADGTEPKRIVGDTYTRYIDWSHDGRWVAFTARPNGIGNGFIDVVPPDGSALKDSNARRNITIGFSPHWSPDDTQVVFNTCTGNNCGIFKSASNANNPVPIVTDGGGLPAWSPDGKKIVYQAETDGQNQLFLINPDGSGKQPLTLGPAMHVSANWSPDGKFIYYRSPEDGTWGIWRMNADGTNRVRLINDVPPVAWPYERLAVTR